MDVLAAVLPPLLAASAFIAIAVAAKRRADVEDDDED